jgi:hypothetical protein
MKSIVLLVFLFAFTSHAQLVVSISPPKISGHKAVVPLHLKNSTDQRIESARAALLLTDEQGIMVGQSTKWVIGDSNSKSSLPAGGTNSFHFVISSDKPFVKTNLTATLSFSRVVFEGGKLANLKKDVTIQNKP